MTRLDPGHGEKLSLLVSWRPRWGKGCRHALPLQGYFQAHHRWDETMTREYVPKKHHKTKWPKWLCSNPAGRSSCLLQPAQPSPHPAPFCCICFMFLLPGSKKPLIIVASSRQGREGSLISPPHIQKICIWTKTRNNSYTEASSCN